MPKSNVEDPVYTPQNDGKSSVQQEEIVLKPSTGWVSLQFSELIRYRELLFFLALRDVKVRYKQTVLGVICAIIQPLLTALIFTLFFGGLAQIPSDGVPYPLFSYAALVPWHFFSNRLALSSNSLVANSNLLTKVYFPRLVIPIATVLAGLVDLVLAFLVLLVFLVVYGVVPTTNVIWLPFFVLLALTTALGVSLWFSAMNVQFRDVRYVVPFFTQAWLFITPIAYPSSLIENEFLRTIYGLNPMTGVVEGFRWALLGVDTSPGPIILASSGMSLILLVTGLFYFRRMEKTFADVV